MAALFDEKKDKGGNGLLPTCILKFSSSCGWLEFEMQMRFQRLDSIYFIVNYMYITFGSDTKLYANLQKSSAQIEDVKFYSTNYKVNLILYLIS